MPEGVELGKFNDLEYRLDPKHRNEFLAGEDRFSRYNAMQTRVIALKVDGYKRQHPNLSSMDAVQAVYAQLFPGNRSGLEDGMTTEVQASPFANGFQKKFLTNFPVVSQIDPKTIQGLSLWQIQLLLNAKVDLKISEQQLEYNKELNSLENDADRVIAAQEFLGPRYKALMHKKIEQYRFLRSRELKYEVSPSKAIQELEERGFLAEFTVNLGRNAPTLMFYNESMYPKMPHKAFNTLTELKKAA